METAVKIFSLLFIWGVVFSGLVLIAGNVSEEHAVAEMFFASFTTCGFGFAVSMIVIS